MNTQTQDISQILTEHAKKLSESNLIIRPEWTNRDDAISFSVSPDLLPRGTFHFKNKEEAKGSVLAEKLLSIPAIQWVSLSPKSLTLGLDEKDEENKWIAPNLAIDHIKQFVKTGEPVVSLAEFEKLGLFKPMTDQDKERLMKGIQELFQNEINPALASHGGRVDLHDLKDYVAFVQVSGGCHGCHSIDATMKQGIEVRVKELFPEITELSDITDHSTGSNPFYA